MSAPLAEGGRPNPLVRYGHVLFRYRDAVFPIVLLALFIGFRPAYPRGNERLDNLVDAVGILVALTGQLFRMAVIGYVYVIRGGKNRRVYAEDLVTEGFFAHSRNPLYLGNLLVLIGLFLIHGNPWILAFGVPFFILGYAAIVSAEEAYLREKFGEAYVAYTRAVPRWIPRLRGLRQSLAGMHFNWRRVVLKEYGSTYAWTAGAVVLLAADTLAYFSFEERATYLRVLAVCLGLLTIGWGTARYLKLTKRLRQAPAS